MSNETLKPCPFCGVHLTLLGEGWDDVEIEKRYYTHPANDCTMFAGWEFDTLIGWNRRTGEAQ